MYRKRLRKFPNSGNIDVMFKLSDDTQLTPSHQFSSSLATKQPKLPLTLKSLNSRPIASSAVKLPEIYRYRSLNQAVTLIIGYHPRTMN